MTRRTIFKTLLAAPLAVLCFWRKPKRHVITADDAFALAKRIHEDDDSLSGNLDMIRGVPPKTLVVDAHTDLKHGGTYFFS